MNKVFLLLKSIKTHHFNEYKNFISKTEIKQKPAGVTSVYVELIEPKYLKEMYEQIRIEK